RAGEERGAGRRSDRPGISPQAAGRARTKAKGRTGRRPRPAHCGRLVVSARHPAICALPVQACAGAGRSLWYAAAGPRRVLHARIAEILESQFAEIAESQPELLARHYAKADLTEKSACQWGKAGQRSQERSALVEAAEQL